MFWGRCTNQPTFRQSDRGNHSGAQRPLQQICSALSQYQRDGQLSREVCSKGQRPLSYRSVITDQVCP